MLILKRPWTRQPQYAVSLDYSNPINSGVVEAYNWGGGKVDVVRGRRATTDYSVGSIGPAGKAVTFSSEKHVITGETWAGATKWTFLTLALPNTSKTVAISFGNGASNGQSYLVFNTTAAYGASAGYVGFGSGALAASAAITAVASGVVAYPAVYVGVQNDQRLIYRDGVLLGAGAASAITIGGSGHVTCFNGIQGYTGWNSTGSQYFLSMIWNRALSESEVAEIGSNPWKLFRPSRIYIPADTAAATVPLLSASTYVAGSLTSTGWRPQITAT